MPRDVSGTYNLPPSNPVTGNAPVSVVWREQTFNDLANAITATPGGAGTVAPVHLDNDPVGFQTKIGVAALVAAFEPRVLALQSANAAKIGRIRGFAFSATPAHYLPCNGAAVSRTQYAALFAKIGTTFGAGDGATTFNLPELRGETLRGWDHGRGVDVGRAIGSAQGSQVPAHAHTASSGTAGAHTHSGTAADGGIHAHTASSTAVSTHAHTVSGTTANHSASHTHTWIDTTNSTGAHTHVFYRSQASGAIASGAEEITTGASIATSSSGAHTHSVSGTTSGQSANHAHAISGTTGTSGAHTHSVTVNSAGAHTHTLTTTTDGAHAHTVTLNSTGGAEMRVDNLALHYCIKFE